MFRSAHGWLIVVALCCATGRSDEPIRVMSFNIRYGKANDGDNHWKHRHTLVVETIREFDPDLLGTQETLGFQADYLKENLTHLTYVGSSRDSNSQGEQCGIMFRTDRFEMKDSGQFWLSETPDQKFSKSWDSSLPRIATWVELTEKSSSSSFLFVNTHFDHRGVTARQQSARVIREFLESQPDGLPVVVTGDFNCGEASEPYRKLVGSGRLSDTYRLAHPSRASGEGTFNGFTGKKDGARIDWVLISPDWKVKSAGIDDYAQAGRYPSDHFPVTATIVRGRVGSKRADQDQGR